MILDTEQIYELTGKRRHAAQARELEHMGIPFKVRRDGSLLVLRIHVEGGQAKASREPQLRLDA